MNPLTPEQIMGQLRTRGFELGGFRNPLRHFGGVLDSITGDMVQRGRMPQPRLEITYTFSEVEVFESTEPYPFPIAQVSVMHSNRLRSGMGVLGASMDKILNAGTDDNIPQQRVNNQDALIGRTQEWKVTPDHMMWDGNEGKEVPRECWEVVYVEGFGGTPYSGVESTGLQVGTTLTEGVKPVAAAETPIQRALNLLDGKTQQQWNNVVFRDVLIKSDATLVNNIITGQLLLPLEESGVIYKDEDGVYHKVSR